MFEYFAQLRKLPEPARRKKALLISLSVTLLIAAIWVVFLFIRVDNGMFTDKDSGGESGSPGIIETFSDFFSKVGDTFKKDETER
jgi:hypothetical protein